jgi:uncharacterized membrane protein
MNWIHVHLALNHLPVFGTVFLIGLLPVALWRRSEDRKRSGLWAAVVLAALSIPVHFTGDFAEAQAHGLPDLEVTWVERHETAADQATTGMFVLGVAAAVGLLLARRGRPVANWAVAGALLLALVTFGLMARAANLGGQIRHPEIRPGFTWPAAGNEP